MFRYSGNCILGETMFCFVVFPLPFSPKSKAISLGTVTLKITLDGNHNISAKNCLMDWFFCFFVFLMVLAEKP